MRVRGPSQVTTIGASLGAWSAITLAATPETASRSLRAAPVLPWVSRSTIAVQVWCASRWGVLLNVRRATVVMAADLPGCGQPWPCARSEEHTSELQSLMRITYAVFCLKKKNTPFTHYNI